MAARAHVTYFAADVARHLPAPVGQSQTLPGSVIDVPEYCREGTGAWPTPRAIPR